MTTNEGLTSFVEKIATVMNRLLLPMVVNICLWLVLRNYYGFVIELMLHNETVYISSLFN